MSSEYTSTYTTARSVAKILSFFGWIFVYGGMLVLLGLVLYSFFVLRGMEGENIGYLFSRLLSGMNAIMAIGCFFSIIVGLITVALGQVVRGTVDNADNTGKMLAIIKTIAFEANLERNRSNRRFED